MTGKIREPLCDHLTFVDNFRVSEKISGIGLLVVVLTLLVVMSIRTVRLRASTGAALRSPRRGRSISGRQRADLCHRDGVARHLHESERVVRAVKTPDNGERYVAVRWLRTADQSNETMLINMIEDMTEHVASNEVAA